MKKPPSHPIIAAIDIGTNSVHMIVARTSPSGFEIITREKDVVRLGEGGSDMDHLHPDAIERGIAALKRMRVIAESHQASVRAVATSAVREAANANEFLRRAKREAGITIEVISGSEEARLIYLGVQQALSLKDRPTLMIDIGGGSTELVVSRDGHLEFAQSVKIGAVRMTDRFFPTEKPSRSQIQGCRTHIASTLAPLAHEINRIGFMDVVVSSGTAETILRMITHLRGDKQNQPLNTASFTDRELSAVVDMLIGASSRTERAAIPGVDDKRADIILAGAIILSEISHILNINNFTFSDYALREGVLFDSMLRSGSRLKSTNVDAGRDSIVMLAERCSVDIKHSGFIATLSQQLLANLREHFELDDIDTMLHATAMLSNVGLAVSHSRHHIHSYYIVRNADLMGFTNEEIEVIALSCRYHRKSGPRPDHAEYTALANDLQDQVDLIAGIVRIATSLDRSHDQSTCIASVTRHRTRDGHQIVIKCTTSSTRESLELNVYTAQQRVKVLEDFLGDSILIVADEN